MGAPAPPGDAYARTHTSNDDDVTQIAAIDWQVSLVSADAHWLTARAPLSRHKQATTSREQSKSKRRYKNYVTVTLVTKRRSVKQNNVT